MFISITISWKLSKWEISLTLVREKINTDKKKQQLSQLMRKRLQKKKKQTPYFISNEIGSE